MDIVIFSFNRAMQLNTLLKSIQQNCLFSYNLYILYNCTEKFTLGYEKLKSKYNLPNIHFVKEERKKRSKIPFNEIKKVFNLKRYLKYKYLRNPKYDFREKLINIISNSDNEFIMFLTDDSLFIRPVKIPLFVFENIRNNPSQNSFSCRLGTNINQPSFYEKIEFNTIKWNYYDNRNKKDWSYNFSVDAHIYDKKYILKNIEEILFSNPNSFEAFMKVFCTKMNDLSVGYADYEPSILSYPINMVQNVQANESLNVSLALLEEMFQKDYEVEYPKIDNISSFQHYPDYIYFVKGNDKIKKKLNDKIFDNNPRI